MSGLDLWRFFFPVRVMAYGATGAVGTRLSLRPLFVFFLLRRTVSLHPSGENPPRDRGSVSGEMRSDIASSTRYITSG